MRFKIESDVLLRNGDTVCDVDLGRFIKYSHYTGKLATIVVVRMRSPFGMVSVEGNNSDLPKVPLCCLNLKGERI